MIGDNINVKPEYFTLSRAITALLKEELKILGNPKSVIGIGGESGCGKSVTATCLEKELANHGIETLTLHLDDYFFLPPLTNHHNRLKDLKNVGLQEVDMDLLQTHVNHFHQHIKSIEAPLVDYEQDAKGVQTIDFEDTRVLIVEGTYVLTLENLDCRIFLSRNYRDTKQLRSERNRDVLIDDGFANQVLEIEHQIIRQHFSLASIVVDKQYQVKVISE